MWNETFPTFVKKSSLEYQSLQEIVARSSGVAAIWTFWIYPGAAESEGAAKVGLKQYTVETILHFQKYSEHKVFGGLFNLFTLIQIFCL